MSGPILGVPAFVIRKMGAQAKKLRFIIYDTGVASPKIAAALKVTTAKVRRWAEAYESIPDSTFAVLEVAYERYNEPGDLGSFEEHLTRYATAYRLPGFRPTEQASALGAMDGAADAA